MANNRIIMTVGRIFESASKPLQGAVFAVDLATGDRTLLSGAANDPAKGVSRVSTGPDLGKAFNVQPSPDGSWYVYSELGVGTVPEATSHPMITKLNPATGVREQQWDLSTFDKCPITSGIAIAKDGSIYGISGSAEEALNGIAKIDLVAKKCAILSGPTVGSGVDIGRDMGSLIFEQGAL